MVREVGSGLATSALPGSRGILPRSRRGLSRCVVYLWAAPNTCLGIAVGLLLGGRFAWVAGVIEIHGPRVAKVLAAMWVPAAAMTLGHVVLGRSPAALARTRRHERVHVRQYERWGIFFLPAYTAASAVLYLLRRDGYRQNPFEVAAFAADETAAQATVDQPSAMGRGNPAASGALGRVDAEGTGPTAVAAGSGEIATSVAAAKRPRQIG